MIQVNYDGQLINIDCEDHGDIEDDIMEERDEKQEVNGEDCAVAISCRVGEPVR